MCFQDLEYQRQLLKYERRFLNISFDQCEKLKISVEVGTHAANQDPLSFTPSYKQLIPGSERPFLGTFFFFRFSPRLSENHHSWVISMGDFGPTASILHYFGHFFLVFSVGSVISD